MTPYWKKQMDHAPTEHYFLAMREMLRRLELPNGFTVLEIGTGWGISGSAFLAGQCSELVTLDPNMSAKYVRDTVQELDGKKRPEQKITYIQASSAFLDARAELKGRTFDLVFVDGRHDYDSVKRDLAAVAAFLKPGGVILCDDYTHPKNGSEYGVAQAVREYMEGASNVRLIEDLTGNGLVAIIHDSLT